MPSRARARRAAWLPSSTRAPRTACWSSCARKARPARRKQGPAMPADEGYRHAPGPGSGPLTYGAYLRVPELLDLQSPLGLPTVHDELLFIIVQQAQELWFKQLLHELR